MLKRVMSRISSNFFCLAVPKRFAGNPSVLCIGKFAVAKKFIDKKGGVSRFSVEYFLSHSDETIFQRYPSVLVFRKFMIAKKFMDMRDGEYQDFFNKFFCLTVLKILVGQHFRVSLISGIEKFYA